MAVAFQPPYPITAFNPPERLLLGPGPSDVPPRVLAAQARLTIGHLDPAFVGMMEELKTLLRYAFQTNNPMTFPVSGPGSAGMEMCFVNLVAPGDKVIVCRNGVFGGRMIENVQRVGASAIVVEDAWGEPVDPHKLRAALNANPDVRTVAFVHAETSTGALSDAQALCRIAHEAGALSIVDAVTSLGGVPLLVDEWGADAVYSGSQKCLSCAPGLSPITFSERAVERVRKRGHKAPSWFLDLELLLGYWGDSRTYHHTAPINSLYGLHESLRILHEEGLEQAWARHRANHLILRAGIEAMGLRFLVAEPYRLPQLNSILIPDGVDDKAIRAGLLQTYGIEIGSGLGVLAGKVWRIGLMGHSSRYDKVLRCLNALEALLIEAGLPIVAGTAEHAAKTVHALHVVPVAETA